jgi:starch synthase
MQIVFLAAEAVPFAKTGGLADVAGALPRALAGLGHHVSLFLPGYRLALRSAEVVGETALTLTTPVGGGPAQARLIESRLPHSQVPVYLIDQPAYFDREALYQVGGKDYPDNCERFVFFQRAVLEAIPRLGLVPDIVHCNDWQTGLIPVYLKTLLPGVPEFAGAGTLFTIHNLAYPGVFRASDMILTGLNGQLFNPKGVEFHGRLSFMKAGLVFADMLSTVSPTYAAEIQTPPLGCGLDGLLRERRGSLRGIVNGIDQDAWSPERETMLPVRYNLDTVKPGKARCKAWLQEQLGLPLRPEVPLFAQIGRLEPQKGWDLLAEVAPRLLARDVQVVILGNGQPRYHRLLEGLARRCPEKLRAELAFNDDLAHEMEAGADLFLMPSLYEPCGLNQLYSLAHGTVPIVRATGGLADTVTNLDPWTLGRGTATGFAFADATAEALWDAIERALTTWTERPVWDALVRNGMSEDWSWGHSAREYVALYEEILRRVQTWPAQPAAG